MERAIEVEKRRYTRVIFNERKRVQAVVALSGQQEPEQAMPASVLNMSEGGMQISIERKKFRKMRQGDAVLLLSITGVFDLESLKGLPMKVIWVMDNEYLEHVLFGMSFPSLSENERKVLRTFVQNRLALDTERERGD